MPSGVVPKKQRSGGFGASTSFSTAVDVACGSPRPTAPFARHAATFARGPAYAGFSSRDAPTSRPDPSRTRGLDQRDVDAELGDLLCECLREAFECPLRRVVHADHRERRDAADARDLQEVSGLLRAEQR